MSASRCSITIDTDRHLLLVIDPSGRRVRSYPVATARYSDSPKFWATDYRNPRGTYHVRSVYPPRSEELQEANSFHVPWYLSSKVRDPHEDAGRGLFGAAMIMLDYPNGEDYSRYLVARRSGCLRKRWEEFCQSHLRPIYEDIAEQDGVPFQEVRIDGDYGRKGLQELLDEFPVADPACAFRLGAGIHGTNDPECIGTNKTAGCFRMHDEDILELLDLIDLGARVEIDAYEFFTM